MDLALGDIFRVVGTVARSVENIVDSVDHSISRAVGTALNTTAAFTVVLAQLITDPAQLGRLVELVETHDFAGLVRALSSGAQFEPDFFPNWVRRAGGYFPKFAQVLSVRADLIHDRAVLDSLARCLEDMPARPIHEVRQLLRQQGVAEAMIDGVRECLSAGSIAQVHRLELPDGSAGVFKVAWPETRERFEADFRLFSHASEILSALNLNDVKTQAVAAMF